MGRYYEAPQEVYELVESIIHERFGSLRAANFKLLMDSKPRIEKLNDRIVFASIKTTNEVERFLSQTGHAISGVDYFIFISDLVWELADDANKKRIVSHELRHCFIDDKGNYRTIKHDIEDFYDEIELNKDDPMWGQAISSIAMAKYEQLKAEARSNK